MESACQLAEVGDRPSSSHERPATSAPAGGRLGLLARAPGAGERCREPLLRTVVEVPLEAPALLVARRTMRRRDARSWSSFATRSR